MGNLDTATKLQDGELRHRNKTEGAPYLARFLRDVGYHSVRPAYFGAKKARFVEIRGTRNFVCGAEFGQLVKVEP
jgi:hypothetical protein